MFCVLSLFSSIPIFLCFPVLHNFTELHLHLLPATTSSRLETHYIFIVFIVAKCTGDTLWRWIKWEKCCTRCVDALLCLHLNKFIPFCFDLMHYTGWGKGKKMSPICFLCLQYCQWFRWGFVCLPEPTHCPVHEETEGHQQISNEKVSVCTHCFIKVIIKYIPERIFTAFSQVI